MFFWLENSWSSTQLTEDEYLLSEKFGTGRPVREFCLAEDVWRRQVVAVMCDVYQQEEVKRAHVSQQTILSTTGARSLSVVLF